MATARVIEDETPTGKSRRATLFGVMKGNIGKPLDCVAADCVNKPINLVERAAPMASRLSETT